MNRPARPVAALLLFGLLILSAVRLGGLAAAAEREQSAFEALAAAIPTAAPTEPVAVEAAPAPENAERFAPLQAANGDFAGWLRIEGTAIDYPVMRCPAEPDFYLTHDFDGNESHSGTPYIGKGCSTDSDNLILYGHNMKNGTMFAALLCYQDPDFFAAHPTIRFDTPEGDGSYEIIAVFREKVHRQDEIGVFRYYDYGGTLSPERFAEFADAISRLSLYDTGRCAVPGRQLLTLSTCAYHTEHGRFVVVAQKTET